MHLSALTLSFLIAAAASPATVSERPQAQPRAATKRAIPESIDRFFRDYLRAVEAGDPAGVLALIDADFVIKWPVGQPISDRERLRAALHSLQQHVRQEVEWEVLEAASNRNWAWARVSEKATHFPKAGGAPRILEGSHLIILRKAKGRWLLHRDQGSLDRLPAGPR